MLGNRIAFAHWTVVLGRRGSSLPRSRPVVRGIRFTVNGQAVARESSADRSRLWALRTGLGLNGTSYGCGEGLCGACTALLDGPPVPARRIEPVITVAGTVVANAVFDAIGVRHFRLPITSAPILGGS